MMLNIDLNLLVQALMVLLISGVGKMIISRLGKIEAHLALLNGRTTRMEEWQIAHGKLDDERFTGLSEGIRELRNGRHS